MRLKRFEIIGLFLFYIIKIFIYTFQSIWWEPSLTTKKTYLFPNATVP